MITRGCVRCKCSFTYKGQLGGGRGSMTRKYCNECKILQHRDESREYMRKMRLRQWFILLVKEKNIFNVLLNMLG